MVPALWTRRHLATDSRRRIGRACVVAATGARHCPICIHRTDVSVDARRASRARSRRRPLLRMASAVLGSPCELATTPWQVTGRGPVRRAPSGKRERASFGLGRHGGSSKRPGLARIVEAPGARGLPASLRLSFPWLRSARIPAGARRRRRGVPHSQSCRVEPWRNGHTAPGGESRELPRSWSLGKLPEDPGMARRWRIGCSGLARNYAKELPQT